MIKYLKKLFLPSIQTILIFDFSKKWVGSPPTPPTGGYGGQVGYFRRLKYLYFDICCLKFTLWVVSSVWFRAPALQAGCRGFESLTTHHFINGSLSISYMVLASLKHSLRFPCFSFWYHVGITNKTVTAYFFSAKAKIFGVILRAFPFLKVEL